MNTIDRPEGFKEKRAELTASRIYKLGDDTVFEPHVATPAASFDTTVAESAPKPNNVVVPMRSNKRSTPVPDSSDLERDYAFSSTESTFEPARVQTSTSANPDTQKDLDDIPF
jgi:hypothetical protein